MSEEHSIGRRLKEIRTWRGLSLRAVAELAGMTAGHLSNIENGKRRVDKRSTLEALAAALRVAPS
ncbi:MAG: helix-turn-helix domain-containing protein [Pseudonocardiaceae bacterium]